jgi:hypothetical protein
VLVERSLATPGGYGLGNYAALFGPARAGAVRAAARGGRQLARLRRRGDGHRRASWLGLLAVRSSPTGAESLASAFDALLMLPLARRR